MSTESASKTSGPPPASSWAAPPEFYADENVVTRSVCRLLRDLGYVVHTPAELYGTREAASGASDDDWLRRVGSRRWAVLNRDLKIFERPDELEAYRRARVHMFLLPGQATSAELRDLVAINLAEICSVATGSDPQTMRLTGHGLEVYGIPEKRRRRRP